MIMNLNNLSFYVMNSFIHFIIFTLNNQGYVFLSLFMIFEVITLNEHYWNKHLERMVKINAEKNDVPDDDGISIFSRRVKRLSKRYSGIIKSRMAQQRELAKKRYLENKSLMQQNNDVTLPTLDNLNEIYSNENTNLSTPPPSPEEIDENICDVSCECGENCKGDIEVIEKEEQPILTPNTGYFPFKLF